MNIENMEFISQDEADMNKIFEQMERDFPDDRVKYLVEKLYNARKVIEGLLYSIEYIQQECNANYVIEEQDIEFLKSGLV